MSIKDNEYDLRAQLLDKLHNINFCAFLTVLSSEMCIEVEIMTSKGTCYSWIGYDDWKIYQVSSVESKKLAPIYDKLKNGNIVLEDLEETCFGAMVADTCENDNLVQMFYDFVTKNITPGEEFFCFYDEGDERYYFFVSKAEIALALNHVYSDVDTLWEDMETKDLSNWLDRYESSEGEIPFCYFGDDE